MTTKEKFEEYKRIRDEGLTNMYNVGNIIRLSGGDLTREDCKDIMVNFDKYEDGQYEEECEHNDPLINMAQKKLGYEFCPKCGGAID